MLTISTASLKGYGIHKIFVLAKKANYDGIDLKLENDNYDSWNSEYVKSLSKAFEIPVVSIEAPTRGMNRKKVDDIISIAKNLGSQVVSFTPPHILDKDTKWFTSYLLKVKKDERLSLSIKNVEAKFIFFVIPEHKNSALVELKKITGDTTLDISNIDLSSGVDLIKTHRILGNTVRNVYLSDKVGPKSNLLPGMQGGGTSNLPIESFLMKLKATSYDGYVTLKVKPSELGAGNDDKVIQNLEYIKKYYQKHFLNYK